MIPAPAQAECTTRVALQFDYQGKRLRPNAPSEVELSTRSGPEDQSSAIKQAIIRWLDAK